VDGQSARGLSGQHPKGQDLGGGGGRLAREFSAGAKDALRSRAKETEQTVEAVCLARFVTMRLIGSPALIVARWKFDGPQV